jgi:RHS repeat-associated protein
MRLSHIRTNAFALAIFVLALAPAAHAQYPGYVTNSNDTGLPSYGSFISSSIDTVNLGNLGVSIRIPIVSSKGRGTTYLLLAQYESKQWTVVPTVIPNGQNVPVVHYVWQPDVTSGTASWNVRDNVTVAYDYTERIWTCTTPPQGGDAGGEIIYPQDPATVIIRSNWVYVSPDGSKHQVPLRKNYDQNHAGHCSDEIAGQLPQNLVGQTDNDHVQVDVTQDQILNHNGITFTQSDGTQSVVGSFARRDTNGNTCCGTSGNWVTDTLGRPVWAYDSASTQNEKIFDVYDSSGNIQKIKIDYISIPLTPAFPTTSYDQFHVVDQPQFWTISVISKVTLANGLSYTFSYDDPDNPGHTNPYGEVTQITLPTGGYVKYRWTTVGQADPGPADPLSQYGQQAYIDSRELAERRVSEDGTAGGEKVWTYGNGVTDPLGNTEIHYFDSCTVPGFYSYTSSPRVETAVSYFDPSGILVKTVQNDLACDRGPVYVAYPGTNLPYSYSPYTEGIRNTRTIRTTTTLVDKNLASKTETDYYDCYSYSILGNSSTDCRMNPTETREFDYGTTNPGSLVRKTDLKYLHNPNLDNASNVYLSAHIWDKVSLKSVYDAGGVLAAQTEYDYDTNAIDQTSGVPQHDYTNYSYTNTLRGNVTLVKRLLTSTSTWLTTTNVYNDVGNLAHTTDPGGHTYNLSYSDNFTDSTNRNSQGFLTSVTSPTTANGVAHVEGKQYFWYTGLTAAVCGQNAPTPATCSHIQGLPASDYASYTYDLMGRPATVTHGDGGVTNFTFNESTLPFSVSSSSAIDSSQNLVNTALIDGLGRVKQTQLNSDPDGVDLVDTTYDALGQKVTVSNPYRYGITSPTDGITTYDYDSLGRTIKVIPPDGSTSSNNVQTFYRGNSVTVVDQAGKARRSYTDALGRLIEVDEPAAGAALPGIAATGGAGSTAIQGSEQATTIQVDDGQVCVIYDYDSGNCISWQEQYHYETTYDSGTLSVTAQGHTDSVSYGSGSTPANLASALAAAINTDSAAPFTASSSGAVLTLNSKATGFAADYVVTAHVTQSNSGQFPSSFDFGPRLVDLLGGADAVPSFPPGEPVSAAPYVTLYTYNTLDDLTCVEQHGTATGQTGCSADPSNDSSSAWRIRRFKYDSLGRLTKATNPESGTICYGTVSSGTCQENGYDADGNVLTKTDARGITTTMTYDQLHRVLTKIYSDGTPTVTMAYDGGSISGCSPTLTITNGVGRRTSMCDAAGWESWAFDSRGHTAADRRSTNGVSKDTTYAYNFVGSETSITYPSGRTITYTVNAAAQVTSASDVANGITYASNAHYAAPGGLLSLQEGSGLLSTMYYNNRLQPCRISVRSSGTAPGSCSDLTSLGNVMDYSYNFGLGSEDNGNIASITNNITPDRSQSFTYDELNRVSTARTQASSGGYAWGLSFGYDAWGNHLTESVTQGSAYSLSVSIDPIHQNNRLSGYSYDAAGNMTQDATNSYTYNAENHIVTAAGVTYTYDGDGNRVQKSSGKIYWYGNGSDALDETDAAGSIANSNFSEFIFFGGNRLARRDYVGNASYYFTDRLGTARIVASASGAIQDDSDYYPFGGERTVTSSGTNNYKFTGKERDTESGLDDIGARHYSSLTGRFMSPDPIFISDGRAVDPQQWNQYTYVRNNPLNGTDPSGMEMVQLGVHDDDYIKKRTSEIKDKLKDKTLSDKDRKALTHERDNLATEKEGNHRVDDYLKSLKDHNVSTAGLSRSSFTISTDAKNDFKEKFPTIDNKGCETAAMCVVIGDKSKQIYLNPSSPDYQGGNSPNADLAHDYITYGGTEVKHEQFHRDENDKSEHAAYAAQQKILQSYGPNAFKTNGFYSTVMDKMAQEVKRPD